MVNSASPDKPTNQKEGAMRQTMKRRLRPIRSMTILTIVAGLFMVAQPNADAITLVPTDLNPGDTYHLVFLTSTTIDATSRRGG